MKPQINKAASLRVALYLLEDEGAEPARGPTSNSGAAPGGDRRLRPRSVPIPSPALGPLPPPGHVNALLCIGSHRAGQTEEFLGAPGRWLHPHSLLLSPLSHIAERWLCPPHPSHWGVLEVGAVPQVGGPAPQCPGGSVHRRRIRARCGGSMWGWGSRRVGGVDERHRDTYGAEMAVSLQGGGWGPRTARGERAVFV